MSNNMLLKLTSLFSDLFLKFRGKKKFVSCHWLEHGIIFDHANIIRVCCEQSHEGLGRYVLDRNFNGIWLDIDKINEEKQFLRMKVRNGQIPDFCKGCQFLKNDYWDDEKYFSHVLLTHWTNCNTRCIYCPAVRDNSLSEEKVYNIIPIIDQLYDSNMINKNTYFSIAGGEATIYPEFDKLVYHLMTLGISNININSSGIKFSPSIEQAIKDNKGEIVISIDSATAYLYNKIKGTNTFHLVINNIKRYLSAQQTGEKRVIVKFILIKGYNDNNKELLDWFMLCMELGVRKLAIDIDISWFKEFDYNIPPYVLDLILFAKSMAKINNLDLYLYDRASIVYNLYKKKKKIIKSSGV